MKIRKIIFSILFFAILAGLLCGYSCYCINQAKKDPYKVEDHDHTYISVMNEAPDTIDVVCLGDSEGMSSINNMRMWNDHGITAYVSGESGAVTARCYFILKNILKTQSPKVVLLEANCLFGSDRESEKKLVGYEKAMDSIYTYFMPGFHFHDVWKNKVPSSNVDRKYYKGQALRTGVDPYDGGEYMTPGDKETPMPSIDIYYFSLIRDLCKEKGITLITYFAPAPAVHDYSMSSTMQRLSEEHGFVNFDFCMLDDVIGIDYQTDILDGGDHVNLSGSTKLSAYLGDRICEICELEDHRGDPRYSSWEEAYDEYAQELTNTGLDHLM